MTDEDQIKSDKVVINESAALEVGTRLHVEPFLEERIGVDNAPVKSILEELTSVFGRAKQLPADTSENHDKYLRDEHST